MRAGSLEKELEFTLEERIEIQEALTTLGYYSGKIDGHFSVESRAAIRNWQSDERMQVDGHLSTSKMVRRLIDQVQENGIDKIVKRTSQSLLIFQECEYCPVMVMLSPGRFPMDSSNEQNSIEVSFAIAKYEVTQDEYAFFAKDTWVKVGQFSKSGAAPAINVSWNDAFSYCSWLAQKTGQAYRLPSEMEWEYAAKAGEDDRLKFGAEGAAGLANIYAKWEEGHADVGRYPPNAWGLYDMYGNVWEWVFNSEQKESRMQRIARGGSWNNHSTGSF